MDIKLNKLDDLNGVITLNIVEGDYSEKVNSRLKEYRKNANLPGYRAGKVPLGIIKKQAGTQVLVEEVNSLISQNLLKFITDEKLEVLGEPLAADDDSQEIDFTKDKDFSFSFKIGFAPEFEISLSKRNKIPYYNIAITDELVDKVIESHASQFGSMRNDLKEITSDKELIKVNLVQLEADSDKPVEEGITQENAMLSLQQVKNEEALKTLQQLKLNDTITVDIKTVVEHEVDLAYMLGIEKEQVADLNSKFQLTVTEISKHSPSEINEELFKKVFPDQEIKTAEEFKEVIKTNQAKVYTKDQDYKFGIDAKDKILEKVKIEIPEAFLKEWLLSKNNELTAEKLDEEWAEYKKTFQWQLFRNKFLKEHSIVVEEADMLEGAKELTRSQFAYYGANFNLPEEELETYAKQLLQNNEQASQIQERVFEQKVVAQLKEVVGLSEKEISMEDFNKMFEDEAAK